MEASSIIYQLKEGITHELLLNPIPVKVSTSHIGFAYYPSRKISNIAFEDRTEITLHILSYIIENKARINLIQSTAIYNVPNILVSSLRESEKNKLCATLYYEIHINLSKFLSGNNISKHNIEIPTLDTIYVDCSRTSY